MLLDKSLINYKQRLNFIYINYNNTILILEVLSVRVPFGIKDYSYNDKTFYYIQISIDKNNLRLNNLLNFIINLEDNAKEYIKDYSLKDKSLFNNKKFISKIYDGNNDPLIRLDFKENTLFKNNLDEDLSLNNYLNKGLIGSLTFSYNGIYIGDKSYGLSFKINQLIIQKDYNKEKTIFTF